MLSRYVMASQTPDLCEKEQNWVNNPINPTEFENDVPVLPRAA